MKNILKVFDKQNIEELKEMLLDCNGNLKIVSSDKLKKFTNKQISQFCVENGIYNLPTLELLELLKKEIGGEELNTIEIGAGNGVLSEKLGIIATDSFQQAKPEIIALYTLLRQPVVKYGNNVLKYDAIKAVEVFKPKIVVGCWVTHKFDEKEAWREGNQEGIREELLIKKCKYIHVGNENTHKNKKILNTPHRTIKGDFLFSRSLNKEKNVVWIWD